MPQNKTIGDTFENLGQVAGQTIKPVTDEAGKLMETAKAQVTGQDVGTGEQGQSSAQQQQQAAQAKIGQMQNQDTTDSEAKKKLMRQRLFQMVNQPSQANKQEEADKEKKKQEEEQKKKVEQFKEVEKKKKEQEVLSVTRAKTAAETNRGASG